MKTNAQRQREWRSRHTTARKRVKRELTMRGLFEYLLEHGPTKTTDLYRAFNAQRDSETWRWLADAIQENALLGQDKIAPVTRIGLGTSASPFYYRTSER